MNKMIIDILDTADGYQIYWTHENDTRDTIMPDDLWYDKYSLLEFIEDKIMEGEIERENITNYLDEIEEDIDEYFENKREEEFNTIWKEEEEEEE